VLQADQDRSSSHDLAARTVAHLKAKVSVDEGPASSTARFDLDEVSGPLKSAGTDGVVDIDDTYDEEIKEQEGAWTHKVKREYAEQVKVCHGACVVSELIFVILVSSFLRASSSPVNPALKNGGSSGFLSFPIVLLVFGSCDPQVAVRILYERIRSDCILIIIQSTLVANAGI
jgi:hypothetical protein